MIDQFPGNLEPNAPVGRKKMLLSAAGVLAILLLPFLFVTLLWRDRCPTTPVHSITSPNGAFVAEQVLKNCGNAMPIAAEIHLYQMHDGKKNGDKTVLILPSEDTLAMVWNADDNVAITLPNNQSQVVSYKREWKGVHINLIGDIISSVPKAMSDQM